MPAGRCLAGAWHPQYLPNMPLHRSRYATNIVIIALIDEPIAFVPCSAPRALGGLGDPRRNPHSPLPFSPKSSHSPPNRSRCSLLVPRRRMPSFTGTARSYPHAVRRSCDVTLETAIPRELGTPLTSRPWT